MVSNPESPSWDSIRGTTKKLLTTDSCKTWGEFKTGVARSLKVSVESLKPWKTQMKQLIAQGGEERETDRKLGDGGDEEDEQESDNESQQGAESEVDENGADSETRSQVDDTDDNSESETRKANSQEDSRAMKACKQMCRAMNLGPAPFRGLKNMSKNDAETTLRERLIDAGARFKGKFPSSMEIAQAKRETDKAKDLEGIDMGNVVKGSRRRGRSDTSSPPKHKRRRVHAQGEGASDDGEGSGASGSGGEEIGSGSSEDSESEFELSG